MMMILKVNIGASRVPTCRISQDFDKWEPDIGFPFVSRGHCSDNLQRYVSIAHARKRCNPRSSARPSIAEKQMQTPTRRRSFTMQSEQYMAPSITLCILSELKMVSP